MSSLVKTSIRLPPGLAAELKELAYQRRTTVSDLLRAGAVLVLIDHATITPTPGASHA